MASEFPYILTLQAVLTASATATLSYPMPNNETLELNSIRFVSTGGFSITDIRDSSGKHYTNASPAAPILSTALQDARNNFDSLERFEVPIVQDGGKTFYIDIIDTSGAGNTVRLFLTGKRSTNL